MIDEYAMPAKRRAVGNNPSKWWEKAAHAGTKLTASDRMGRNLLAISQQAWLVMLS